MDYETTKHIMYATSTEFEYEFIKAAIEILDEYDNVCEGNKIFDGEYINIRDIVNSMPLHLQKEYNNYLHQGKSIKDLIGTIPGKLSKDERYFAVNPRFYCKELEAAILRYEENE